MLGAMSHVDTFDYKPTLEKMHGQELPPSVRGTHRLSTMVGGQTSFPIVGPLAEVQAARAERAMDQRLAAAHGGDRRRPLLIKTMHTEHVNHDPASKFLHTGFPARGPAVDGAWVSYALGSDNKDLPTFS